MKLRRLHSASLGFDDALASLTAFDSALDEGIEKTVRDIIRNVRTQGDQAVLDYTHRFDRWLPENAQALELSPCLMTAALAALPASQRHALETSAQRIRRFHERQRQDSWTITEDDGTVLGQQVTSLDRVGLYVPGGKAVYPSSVLMNALPAVVAGVREIIMVVPTPDQLRNELVLAAAALAGVQRVFTIGGAQAVAALAYGTATIPAVDKIVGPGNAYVAAAKRQVFGQVGIDMVAGPSEILVIADGTTDPRWVAMDLFSQAEHDEMAQAILLCPSSTYLDQVEQALDNLLPTLPRQQIVRQSLGDRGALIEVRDLAEACALANRIAPEHLELSVADPDACLPLIRHAGAIFMGAYSSESLGDYCAGPNHVLPTGRTARFTSPLGVHDFQKRSSLLKVSRQGAATLGVIAEVIALQEGLHAHARAASCRFREEV